jgi:hypothetical protein
VVVILKEYLSGSYVLRIGMQVILRDMLEELIGECKLYDIEM